MQQIERYGERNNARVSTPPRPPSSFPLPPLPHPSPPSPNQYQRCSSRPTNPPPRLHSRRARGERGRKAGSNVLARARLEEEEAGGREQQVEWEWRAFGLEVLVDQAGGYLPLLGVGTSAARGVGESYRAIGEGHSTTVRQWTSRNPTGSGWVLTSPAAAAAAVEGGRAQGAKGEEPKGPNGRTHPLRTAPPLRAQRAGSTNSSATCALAGGAGVEVLGGEGGGALSSTLG